MKPLFPEALIRILIVGALALTSVSILMLLGLLLRDFLKRRLW